MAKTDISFEFFPPKTEQGRVTLVETLERLQGLSPRFLSVTHGAGGSDGGRSLETVRALRQITDTPVAAHLTCVGRTIREVDQHARTLWAEGITRIVALRGDPPRHANTALYNPNGYPHASDLVAGMRRVADFDISVAAFPEGHPETDGVPADILNLKRKEAAGANRALTQFFFDSHAFLRYRDAAARAGIRLEIVPGLFPIASIQALQRFAATCGASVPGWVVDAFDGYEDDQTACHEIAVDIAARQIERLRANGVSAFHFYTLNKADLTIDACRAADLIPSKRAAA